MEIYNLILSEKKSSRIQRHAAFWCLFYIYQVIRMSFLFPANQLSEKLLVLLSGALKWGIFTNAIFCYTVIYFLIPKFFSKKRYIIFALALLLLYVVLFCLNLLYDFKNIHFISAVGTTSQQPYIWLRGSAIRLLGNPPLICGFLLSARTLKNWHFRQLENETLSREKTHAELQLLKAQIHPHFLFNTLNNIYSFTLTKSPVASELVQKLSDMLNYMITDCDRTMVPVEKEIQLLKDYIGLEKVRYGDRLDIQMHVKGDCKNCMIAPLLMIPFVENSFKHGASMMRGKQWMHFIININENDLELNLSNSKPPQTNSAKNKNGIGLLNVQKRLALLYPNKHQLQINSTDNTFSVYLKIELQKQPLLITKEKISNTPAETFLEPNIHN